MKIDDVVFYNGNLPEEIKLDEQTTSAQTKLINQFGEDDKQIIFKLIEKMLANKKFKDFFNKNVGTL